MVKRESPVNIFTYLDYRTFLREWYEGMKASRRAISFRAFSQRAGFTSPNILKLVMDGARNLTDDSIGKFIVGLHLNKQEGDFFRQLVLFTQAATHEEKDRHYQRMLQSRKLFQVKPLERSQYDYYAQWYHPVIRELIAHPRCDGTPQWIARHLRPAISMAQAEQALIVLAQLGMIRERADGRWEQAHTLVTTGPEVASMMVMKYHQELLKLSATALERIPARERDVSAMVLGVSAEKMPLLKRRIQEFRQELLKFVANDTAPELVVQLNLQCYPVSRSTEGDEQ